jgi:hypothetical protein
MTNYPLNWGWDQPDNSKASSSSDGKPKPTLLGGHDGDVNVAAAGDLRCEGIRGGSGCSSGGTHGSSAPYSVEGRNLCETCAIRAIGAGGLPGGEKSEMLQPFLIRGR